MGDGNEAANEQYWNKRYAAFVELWSAPATDAAHTTHSLSERRERFFEEMSKLIHWLGRGIGFQIFMQPELPGRGDAEGAKRLEAFNDRCMAVRRAQLDDLPIERKSDRAFRGSQISLLNRFPPRIRMGPWLPWPTVAQQWLDEWLFGNFASEVDLSEQASYDMGRGGALPEPFGASFRALWLGILRELPGVQSVTEACIVRRVSGQPIWGDGWGDWGLGVAFDLDDNRLVLHASVCTD